jgi:hypothetical protein
MALLLAALAVPASAGAFVGDEVPVTPAALTATASSSTPFLMGEMPTPLLMLLAGALLVGVTIRRRLHKSPLIEGD